jgi:hypothetical protein
MEELIEGFRRFREEAFPAHADLFRKLAHAQSPHTLFVACSDSRVVPELLTQRQPGEMFVIRNAGNIVPSHGSEAGGVSAGIEYAVAALGVRDVVICGHSDCGAMTALTHDHDLAPARGIELAAPRRSGQACQRRAGLRVGRGEARWDGPRECRRPDRQSADAPVGGAGSRPGSMTDLRKKTFLWFGEQLSGGLSRPGLTFAFQT